MLRPTAAPVSFSEEATEDIRRTFWRRMAALERRRERVAVDINMVRVVTIGSGSSDSDGAIT